MKRTTFLGFALACRGLILQTPLLISLQHGVVAFAPNAISRTDQRSIVRLKPRLAVHFSEEVMSNDDGEEESYVLKDIKPLIKISTDSEEKIINAFGLWCLAMTLFTAPAWMAVMMVLQQVNKSFENFDPNRAIYDKTGKIWSKIWLTLTDSYPTITGDLEFIKESSNSGPCLYVANHASWLDIPVLCTVLDPVFKFIAKGELVAVPCIGHQLKGGNHILIDREDRRSQIRTFKEGITWLKNGVPIMAFPEGMRSRDGRLMAFKGGLFSMAVKTKVPIVPITISNTHAVFPANAVFPVQRGGSKLQVHVHSPIDTTDKTEAELEILVREAFLSKLPKDQHPLPAAIETKEATEQVVVTDASQDLHHHQQHQLHQLHQPRHHVDFQANGHLPTSSSASSSDTAQGDQAVDALETTTS